ncbi:hypothetical protein Y032_0170g264 [Ancylostoma ceylanicum]|uniref:Uncharacterized protein n=1 Tax=Ancylostoma ceylanicum TaxID=53326 RepID=A0A016SVQ1_9BILA|nr:hypothetical protein Y032_0170g264 [Ancylostoma ceylanicum]
MECRGTIPRDWSDEQLLAETDGDRMTPAPIPTDKRLHAKRAVRRVTKEVRTSMKSRSNGGEEFWRILEK